MAPKGELKYLLTITRCVVLCVCFTLTFPVVSRSTSEEFKVPDGMVGFSEFILIKQSLLF